MSCKLIVITSLASVLVACGGSNGDLALTTSAPVTSTSTSAPPAMSAATVRSPLEAAAKAVDEAQEELKRVPLDNGSARIRASIGAMRAALAQVAVQQATANDALTLYEKLSSEVAKEKAELAAKAAQLEQQNDDLTKRTEVLELRETLFKYGLAVAIGVFIISLFTLAQKTWADLPDVRLKRLLVREKSRELTRPWRSVRRRRKNQGIGSR